MLSLMGSSTFFCPMVICKEKGHIFEEESTEQTRDGVTTKIFFNPMLKYSLIPIGLILLSPEPIAEDLVCSKKNRAHNQQHVDMMSPAHMPSQYMPIYHNHIIKHNFYI